MIEEKLFELMAAADDLQTHAAKLQVSAEEVLDQAEEKLSKAADQAEAKLSKAADQAEAKLSTAVDHAEKRLSFVTGVRQAVLLLGISIIVLGIGIAVMNWQTSSLREEAAELRAEVAVLEKQAADFASKAGKAELSTCGKGKTARLCIRVDEQAGKYGTEGDRYMIIHGY